MLRTVAIIVLLVVLAAIVVALQARRREDTEILAGAKGEPGSFQGDRQVLAALRNAGADLSKATEVNYYLYFRERSAADSAAGHAGSGPMAATVRRAGDDSAWLLLVSGTMVPSEAAIHEHTVRLVDIAQRYGGEYDGWEAAVRK